ncbi:MAG: transcription antitermination factor NusB [Rhodospirillales bacterium]|nr:transcription antitermination factor NusB [Alphaproteobacteria bacterium]MBL6947742.1 transcription antitermination factor NusB [Rhodospirillales bacterium]
MTTSAENGINPTGNRRSSARLAAVQALYEMDMVDADADAVLEEFMLKRWTTGEDEQGKFGQTAEPGEALAAYLGQNGGSDDGDGNGNGDLALVEPDRDWLRDLVQGVAENRDKLDGLIGPVLKGEWTVERLEPLIRVLLRAAIYELDNKPSVPASVVINEYMNVAHAFFEGPETGLINGILDRLARDLRTGEL